MSTPDDPSAPGTPAGEPQPGAADAGLPDSDAELAQLQRQNARLRAQRDELLQQVLGPRERGRDPDSGARKSHRGPLLLLLIFGVLAVLVVSSSMRLREATRELATLRESHGTRRAAGAAHSARARRGFRADSPWVAALPLSELFSASSMAYASAARVVAVGDSSGRILIYELGPERALHVIEAHRGEVRALCFTPDETRLISGGRDGAVYAWDWGAGQRLHALRSVGAPAVFSLAATNEHVAVGSESPTIELYRGADYAAAGRLDGATDWVRALAFSASGCWLASGGHDGKLRLYERQHDQYQPGPVLPGHGLWITAVAIHPDEVRIASAGFDQEVRIWDRKALRQVGTLNGYLRAPLALAFADDGSRLASAGLDRVARVFSTKTWQEEARFDTHRFAARAVAFGCFGHCLLTASSEGTLHRWPLPARKPRSLAQLPAPAPGELDLRSNTSGERTRVTLIDPRSGTVLPPGLTQLSHALRSIQDDRETAIAPRLARLLYDVAEHFGRAHEVVIVSGYRSPAYNAVRAAQSAEVSQESLHQEGLAVDFRIDGVAITVLEQYVSNVAPGGVGYYADSKFIHMDLGSKRRWVGN